MERARYSLLMDTWITLEDYDRCSGFIATNPCPIPAYWEIESTGEDVEHGEETQVHAQACREHLEYLLVQHELMLTGTYHHVERHYA